MMGAIQGSHRPKPWCDHRIRFKTYQKTPGFGDAPDLRAPYCALFLGLKGSTDTLFIGLYAAELVGPLPADRPHPITGNVRLKDRDASDYRVATPETIGSITPDAELLTMEAG